MVVLGCMTAEQVEGWEAFNRLEPFGPGASWVQAGTLASATLAPWCKKGDVPSPSDIFPHLKDPDDEEDGGGWQSLEEQELMCRALVLATGGKLR